MSNEFDFEAYSIEVKSNVSAFIKCELNGDGRTNHHFYINKLISLIATGIKEMERCNSSIKALYADLLSGSLEYEGPGSFKVFETGKYRAFFTDDEPYIGSAVMLKASAIENLLTDTLTVLVYEDSPKDTVNDLAKVLEKNGLVFKTYAALAEKEAKSIVIRHKAIHPEMWLDK